MKHFLEISQLSAQQIHTLLERAFDFKTKQTFPALTQHTLANLFYENSTRTRVSFELAAKRLSMNVINVALQHSSENKGEIIQDTIQTLAAMGIDCFAIRHSQDGLPQQLAEQCHQDIHIINAGDGTHAHPSQALLDVMTIIEHKPQLTELKIAIIGDVKHSRVANSLQWIFATLHVGELVFIAPKAWQPETIHYGRVTDDITEGLAQADVIICLRVQHERLHSHEQLDLNRYRNAFALTPKQLARAKPNAIIMHPGPINRGIELDSELADGPQSVILDQVRNGVFARMAILEWLVTH